MRAWAILILVLLGAVARLASLGSAALDPGEAAQAAAAWSIVERDAFDPARLSPQPESALLASISSLLFFVFDGGGDLFARLPSALCGIALVLLALRLGRDSGALALAALVAVDPWLVAASRRGSGAIFAAATAIVGWLLLRRTAEAGTSAAVEPARRRLCLGVGAAIGVLAVTGA